MLMQTEDNAVQGMTSRAKRYQGSVQFPSVRAEGLNTPSAKGCSSIRLLTAEGQGGKRGLVAALLTRSMSFLRPLRLVCR
jgi:hypothetical protein